MPKRTTDYQSALIKDLKDPTEAARYLTAAFKDSENMFLVALRDVAEAHQMSKVAGKVGVSRESLYRMLNSSGNPTYRNFLGILRALDVTFERVRARASTPPKISASRKRIASPPLRKTAIARKRVAKTANPSPSLRRPKR